MDCSFDEEMDVVAAAIVSGGRVLIAKRKAGAFMGGRWEFPGGKVEAGESPEDALVREIGEELGFRIRVVRLFHVNVHIYCVCDRKRKVTLHTFVCEPVVGEPRCIGCDEYCWVRPSELSGYDFVDGDLEVVGLLGKENI